MGAAKGAWSSVYWIVSEQLVGAESETAGGQGDREPEDDESPLHVTCNHMDRRLVARTALGWAAAEGRSKTWAVH